MNFLKRLILPLACLAIVGGCGNKDELQALEHLHTALQDRAYGKLEQALDDGESQYRKGKLSANSWAQRITEFATSPGMDNDKLDRWVNATHSGYAHLVRGLYLQHDAWRLRGQQAAADTTELQFAMLRQRSQQARRDLIEAGNKIARCAICVGELINNNRALADQSTDRKLLETALEYDPKMWMPVIAYYQGIPPRWDNYDDIAKFISEVRERIKDDDLASLLESQMYRDKARHALLKPGFDSVKNATDYYEQGVTPKPDSRLMRELATIYSKRGQYSKSVEVLEREITVNGDTNLAKLDELSDAYFAAGQSKKSLKIRERREELVRNYPHVYGAKMS